MQGINGFQQGALMAGEMRGKAEVLCDACNGCLLRTAQTTNDIASTGLSLLEARVGRFLGLHGG